MSKTPDDEQLERLRKLAEMPDEGIDTSDIPVATEEQWTTAVRGGERTKLKNASIMPIPAVYKRSSKDGLYAKVNEDWQIPVTLENGEVLGNGLPEEIDPDEIVIIIAIDMATNPQ